MEDPAVDDFTVKVATPDALVVPLTVVMVSVAPRLEESETDFPETGLLLASLRVTVIVEVAELLAVTEAVPAETVD